MNRPRALDLFCRAGGVSEGLLRAGFDVVGVDVLDCSKAYNRGPGSPERHERPALFVQADALEYPLEGFDFIWASPPCQAFSSATRITGRPNEHADLVTPTRERLRTSRTLWVIENVPGAPLRHGFVLCGAAFALSALCADGRRRPLKRHRLFEPSFAVLAPPCCCGTAQKVSVFGDGGAGLRKHRDGYERYRARRTEAAEAMGIDWMSRADIIQAIPPAYAEWIGIRRWTTCGAHIFE